MDTYEISSPDTTLGLYQGRDWHDATKACLADAGHRGHFDDLRARQLDGTPTLLDSEGRETLSHETGTCDVCGRGGWRSDHPDGLEDVLVADYHRAGELTCGRCAALLVEAEDELEHWISASGRYGDSSVYTSVAAFELMCLECFGVDEGLVDLRPGSGPDGTKVMYDEYGEVVLRAIEEEQS